MSDNIFMPSYAKDFSCIMGDCPENCCVEWIVDLDDNTKAFYDKADGEIGEKIRSNMEHDEEDDENVFSLVKGKNHVREWKIEFADDVSSSDNSGNSESGKTHENALEIKKAKLAYISDEYSNTSDCDINCPFQQDDGLCEIRLKLGYEHTSETCREHPEFNEEYEDFTERSFSLSCPEIARLIAETPLKLDFDEDDEILLTPSVYPSAPASSSDSVLNALCRARNKFFFNFDEDEDIVKHCIDLRDTAFFLQPQLNQMDEGFAVELPEKDKLFLQEIFVKLSEIGIFEKKSNAALEENSEDIEFGGAEKVIDKKNIDELTERFSEYILSLINFCIENLDFLTERWKKMLSKTVSVFTDSEFSISGIIQYYSERKQYISRIFAYFVYRYFLKAVNDCDIIKWSEFIVKCTIIPIIVSFATGKDLFRVAALFSREIEHDGDNASLIMDLTDFE